MRVVSNNLSQNKGLISKTSSSFPSFLHFPKKFSEGSRFNLLKFLRRIFIGSLYVVMLARHGRNGVLLKFSPATRKYFEVWKYPLTESGALALLKITWAAVKIFSCITVTTALAFLRKFYKELIKYLSRLGIDI